MCWDFVFISTGLKENVINDSVDMKKCTKTSQQ